VFLNKVQDTGTLYRFPSIFVSIVRSNNGIWKYASAKTITGLTPDTF
jgi:hypothetical protein